MIEKHPQLFLLLLLFSMQAFLKAATFFSSIAVPIMISELVSMESPCREYSGHTNRSMLDKFLRTLATMAMMRCVCAARSSFGRHKNNIGDANHGAVGALVPTTETAAPCPLVLLYDGSRSCRLDRIE